MTEPKKWSMSERRCRFCGRETTHQFTTSEAWICLRCGTYWTTPEEREERTEAVADVTAATIWGGD